MLNFFRSTLSPRRTSRETLRSPGSLSVDRCVEVRVGGSTCAQDIEIPYAAMKACPYLRERLVNGSRIPHVDPFIFQIVIDCLDSGSLFDKITSNSPNPLEMLLDCKGDRILLNFAKAWHLAHALDLRQLQNELVDFYRGVYEHLLQKGARMALAEEAFAHLHSHVGYHTPAEKFLIEFHAGLYRFSNKDMASELRCLPEDIAQCIRTRHHRIAWLGDREDRILRNDGRFKVQKLDRLERRGTLTVLSPPLVTTPIASPALSSRRGSGSGLSYFGSRASSVMATSYFGSISETPVGGNDRALFSFPEMGSLARDPEGFVEHELVPGLTKKLGDVSPVDHNKPSPMTDYVRVNKAPKTKGRRQDSADLTADENLR